MTTTITLHLGDVRDVMAALEDNSADLLVTSPPFLALRSYLPSDHPDKHREIGAEPTPAAFLDTILGLTADWRRIVTDTGTIAVEIGDTYSGSGGAGGDYGAQGLRDGQPKFDGSGRRNRPADVAAGILAPTSRPGPEGRDRIPGWPLAKSLTGIPTLYTWSLAYGRNLLTGTESPAGQWRIRNLLTWTRPNPPVGALGDKFRPATSFVTVACTSAKRWFDLDAVRGGTKTEGGRARGPKTGGALEDHRDTLGEFTADMAAAGAPPLDWWDANDCDELDAEGHDWQPLHRLPTAPYKGSHYATYPVALPERLIKAMCPFEVCRECGEPRRRQTVTDQLSTGRTANGTKARDRSESFAGTTYDSRTESRVTTLGWTDCCVGVPDHHRPGIVLDPFGGSGTTAIAAAIAGRDAILIDFDSRNVELVRERITSSLRLVSEQRDGDTITWTVEPPLPAQRDVDPGQMSVFDIDGDVA